MNKKGREHHLKISVDIWKNYIHVFHLMLLLVVLKDYLNDSVSLL